MKRYAVIALLLLPIAAHSAEPSLVYSIDSVSGDMPIRSVILKRVGPYFTSYLGFQFDCVGQNYSQTGFHNSPEAVTAELANIRRISNYNWEISDMVRVKACSLDSRADIISSTQSLSAP